MMVERWLPLLVWLACFRVGTAASTCPSISYDTICSGHGKCGGRKNATKAGVCDCYAGWDFSADCSKRSCPSGTAWFDKATAVDTAHAQAECSNAGVCDRGTGICKCYAGHSGFACQRTACDCSGHGYCKTIGALALDNAGVTYTNWDADVIQMCYCDDSYTGYDCSQMMCPKGDDPKTTSQVDRIIRVTTGASSTLSGTFTLSFGGRDVKFDADGSKMGDCQKIVDQFNNIKSATCVLVGSVGSKKEVTFDVTLKSYPTLAKQNNIFFHYGQDVDATKFYCRTGSALPKGAATCTVTVTNPTADVKEYAYCSNSGICDFTKGLCTCFTGFSGAACQTKSTTVTATTSEPVYQLESQSTAYTGVVLDMQTYKASASDFSFIDAAQGASASSSGTSVFNVRGDGQTTVANLVATKGVAASGAQSTIADGLLLTGDLTMTNVKGALASNKDADAANPLLDIKSTSTKYQSDVLRVTATRPTLTTNYNLLNLKGATKDIFTVRGDGQVTADTVNAVTLAVSTQMTLGGTLTSTGDIQAKSLSSIQTAKDASALTATTSAADFASTAASISVERGLQTAGTYKFLEITAGTGGTKKVVFDIDSDGKTKVHEGGLEVDSGGLLVKSGGLTVSSGAATIASGGLNVQNGGVKAANSAGAALTVTGDGTLTTSGTGGSGLHLKATASNYAGSVLKLEHAVASATGLDFIHGKDASGELFAVDGEGHIQTKATVRGSVGFGMQEVDKSRVKQPTCDAASRGLMYQFEDAGTNIDVLQVCVKTGATTFKWKTVTLT